MADELKQPDPPEEQGDPFINFADLLLITDVKKHGNTVSLDEHVNDMLRETASAARYHGKEASLTIKLTLKPGSGKAMAIIHDVTNKVPVEKPAPKALWVDDEGRLLTDNPDQQPIKQFQRFSTHRRDRKDEK